jgi:hypothetical protein
VKVSSLGAASLASWIDALITEASPYPDSDDLARHLYE